MLVLSLGFALMPSQKAEAQAFLPNQWNSMPLPTPAGAVLVAGGDITDFVVASNGKTIYLVDTTLNQVARSDNGGRTFTVLASYAGASADLVAVAPDNPEVVAVVDNSTAPDTLYISTNGGATWANLAFVGTLATEVITGVAVGPADATALLNREYVVCTADPAAGVFGDVWMIGVTNAWVNESGGAGLIIYDFTSLAMAANWFGQWAIVAVGSDNVGASNPEVGTPGDTWLIAINASPIAGPVAIAPTPVNMDTLTYDSPAEIAGGGAASAEIISSSVALPFDFDATSPVGFRSFVGWASQTLAGVADDVFRVDFNAPRKLDILPTVQIQSLSYSGTVAAGTLFAGAYASNTIWFTSNPGAGAPTWGFSFKPPTVNTPAAGNNTRVAVSPDFAASNVVYAGCTDAAGENAFSKSADGGLSFNGISWIDTAIVNINDVMPSPDGKFLFMSTEDAAPDHSLWRCPGPTPAVGAWDRVHLQLLARFTTTGDIVRLSPANDAIYWADYNGSANIVRSVTNGQIWANMTAAATLIRDIAVENKDTLYMIRNGFATVSKSTSGGWNWGLPVTPPLGQNLATIAMAPSYPYTPVAGTVVVGGVTGGIGLSLNGATSFIPLLNFNATGIMQVVADKDYATNSTLYAGSSTAGEGISRYIFGTSSAWETIDAIAGNTTGLAMYCGTLYGAWDTAGDPSAVDRSLYPTIPNVAGLLFQAMNVPAAIVAATDFARLPSSLRAVGVASDVWLYGIDISGADRLLAYDDSMAKAKIDVTVPASVANDPSSGYNTAFVISWNEPSNAFGYAAGIYTDPICSQLALAAPASAVPGFLATAYVPPFALAPSWTVAQGQLVGGTYYVRVFATEQVTAEAINSPFAPADVNVVEFAIEAGVPVQAPNIGPTLLGPQPGADNVNPGVAFSWTPQPKATAYSFILATDSALTQVVVSETVNSPAYGPITLDYGKDYFWAVKVTAPSTGPQAFGTFTTMPEPIVTPVQEISPAWIWAVVIIGAILVIVVIALIFTTRRTT